MSLKSLGDLIGKYLRIGTVFPTAYANLPFFRIDLGVLCWYNSTASAWLGPEQQIAFVRYSDSQDPPYNISQQALIVPNRKDYVYYATRYSVGYYVAGTNDGSNYWDVKWDRRTTGNGESTLATLTTSDKSGSTNDTMATSTFANNPTVSTDWWQTIELTKVGSPGSLYLHGIACFARVIYT